MNEHKQSISFSRRMNEFCSGFGRGIVRTKKKSKSLRIPLLRKLHLKCSRNLDASYDNFLTAIKRGEPKTEFDILKCLVYAVCTANYMEYSSCDDYFLDGWRNRLQELWRCHLTLDKVYISFVQIQSTVLIVAWNYTQSRVRSQPQNIENLLIRSPNQDRQLLTQISSILRFSPKDDCRFVKPRSSSQPSNPPAAVDNNEYPTASHGNPLIFSRSCTLWQV